MHIPVLKEAVIKYLDPKPNENFIDCTIGDGGHALVILEKNGPGGKVLGIDEKLRLALRERLILAEDNFANLKNIVEKYKFRPVNGILFDLGMSSWHLEESLRGFSFNKKEPLDMRYNAERNLLTAERIVNYWSKSEIERILSEYGEEKKADRISQKIIDARKLKPIKDTLQLAEIIKKSGGSLRQTFQAIRIAVNNELDNLSKALPEAIKILAPGGRLVVISFHSLEDRIVKNFFKDQQKFLILTKKPITPDSRETRNNPRARSAKLRAVIKK